MRGTDGRQPPQAEVHHLAFNYPQAEAAYDEAFACKVGTPMAPAIMHRVW